MTYINQLVYGSGIGLFIVTLYALWKLREVRIREDILLKHLEYEKELRQKEVQTYIDLAEFWRNKLKEAGLEP